MAGRDIRAGGAYVQISARDQSLAAGLKRAQMKIKAFAAGIRNVGIGMAGAGTAMLAPMLAAAKGFADSGSALNDMSARTGVSVEALSELSYAAKQAGSDAETLEGGLRKMQKGIAEAADGSKSAVDALGKLGLTVTDLKDLSPDKQFEAIANRINAISDPTARAAAAMELFGKSGTALLPMIGDMAALRSQAQQLGLVMSTADAQAADALGDAMDTLGASLGAVRNAIGGALAPALTTVAGSLTLATSAVSAFMREHQQLILTVAGVGTGLVALGTTMAAFGTVLTQIGPVVKIVGAGLAVLSSPVTLVAGGLAALAGTFAYVAIEGETLSEKLGTAWAWIQETGASVTSFLQAAWAATLEFLSPVFNTIAAVATDTFASIYAAVVPIAEGVRDSIISAWGSIAPYVQPALEWLRDATIGTFVAAGFAIQNFGQLVDFTLLNGMYSVVKFANEIAYQFTDVIPGVMSWFIDNWQDVLQTGWNSLKTLATNIGVNLANLWKAIMGVFNGEGWNFEWTGLYEGFEVAIKELPKIAQREIGALEGALKSEMDAIGAELSKDWDQYISKLGSKIGGPSVSGAPGGAAALPAPAALALPGSRDFASELALGGRAAEQKYSTLSQFGGAGLGMTGGSSAVLDRLDRLHRDMQQLTEATKKNKPAAATWCK